MTRVQHQSDGFKYGNPPDHEQAVINVKHFMIKNELGRWVYWFEHLEIYDKSFIEKEKLRRDYTHSYDIAVSTPHNMEHPFLFIEVDGEKHPTELQRKMGVHFNQQQLDNDKIAEKYVKEFLKQDIIRLEKLECNGLPKDRDKYLRDKLKAYIK